MKKNYFTVILIFMTILILGCSGDTAKPIELSISAGLDGTIQPGQPLQVSVTGLKPGEYPVILEAINSNNKVVSKGRLSAGMDGKIENFILAYDIGMEFPQNEGRLPPGDYVIRLTSSKGISQVNIHIPVATERSRIWSCDINGDLTNGYETGTPVFVRGKALDPKITYRIWPVMDRRSWSDGDTFKGWRESYPAVVWPPQIQEYIEVQSDSDGNLAPVQLLPYAIKNIPDVTDQFDIILDAPPYKVFNAGSDAVDGGLPTGAVVQDPSDGSARIEELACRKNYVYTNIFYKGEPIYIWLNPGTKTLTPHVYVYKYVTAHRDEWIDGAAIIDISGGAESDPVEFGCANEGLVLVWPSSEIGEYDALIDMNLNGIYDEGIDILDGGPTGPGFKVINQ